MKTFIKIFLIKLSRIIFNIFRIINFVIPKEFKDRGNLYSKLKENLTNETLIHFEEHIKNSIIFEDVLSLRESAIKTSLSNDENKSYYYLEFGVYKAQSSNFFSKFVNKLYCFDSFEGLKEDWVGSNKTKDHFNLNKKIPNLNSNIEPVVGWVEDTLDDFLKKHNPKINFVHLDMDTYSSTKFTLEKIKPYLVKNSIIVFDQLYNYLGWKNGEFKALKEEFKEDEYLFRGFNVCDKQCYIQMK